MSEATFCESVRQRDMEQQSITQQILAKIEKIEDGLNQIMKILNQSNNEK